MRAGGGWEVVVKVSRTGEVGARRETWLTFGIAEREGKVVRSSKQTNKQKTAMEQAELRTLSSLIVEEGSWEVRLRGRLRPDSGKHWEAS